MTEQEMVTIQKVFSRYTDAMKSRSTKWSLPGNSRVEDRRIKKFLKTFFIPCTFEEVMGYMDTTTFRTGTEGYLFTTKGVVVKEIANKLYYLEYEKLSGAEVEQRVDEYYNYSYTLWANFKDGTRISMFDFYINRNTFADYINDVVAVLNHTYREPILKED